MRVAVNGWFADQIATGSGQYLTALIEWLPQAGAAHELYLVLPSVAPDEPISGVEALAGRPINARDRLKPPLQLQSHDLPPGWTVTHAATPFDGSSRNLAKLWFEQVAFPAACRRIGADVALIPYWGAPWRGPCPVVVTIHDLIPVLLPLYRGGAMQRAYTALAARSARRAAAVLTDSEAGKRDVVAHLGIAQERVHAIHLAAGDQFRPVTDPEDLSRVQEKYALPAAPFLLYLGGFDARKNVPRMLEGYARIPAPRPPLVIGGRLPAADSAFAPDPRPIAARLGIAGDVHFIGWVEETDKPALYSLALASLYLSEYEGFGLPVLEAMGCGCAVIAGQ